MRPHNVYLVFGLAALAAVAITCGGDASPDAPEVPAEQGSTGTVSAPTPSAPAPAPVASTPSREPVATPTPGGFNASRPSVDRITLAKELDVAIAEATLAGDWAEVYAHYPEQFKEKCDLSSFAELMTFTVSSLGSLDDVTFAPGQPRLEWDFAYTTGKFMRDGVPLEYGPPSNKPRFVWRDAKWNVVVPREELEKDNPCSLPAEG